MKRGYWLFMVVLLALTRQGWAGTREDSAALLQKPVSITYEHLSLIHLDRAFEQFAAAAQIDLIAQHYRKLANLPEIPSDRPVILPLSHETPVPLKTAVQELCQWAGYTYKIEGGVLVLRNETQYRDDDFQLDLDLDRRIRAMNPNTAGFRALVFSEKVTPKQRYLLSFDLPIGPAPPADEVASAPVATLPSLPKDATPHVDHGLITAHFPAIKLASLLDAVSPFLPKVFAADPSTANRPVSVFIHHLDLSTFRLILADVYHLKWKETPGRDILYQDPKSRVEEEHLREAEREKERQNRLYLDTAAKEAVDNLLNFAGDEGVTKNLLSSLMMQEGGPAKEQAQWALKAMFEAGGLSRLKAGEDVEISRTQLPDQLLRRFESDLLPEMKSGLPQAVNGIEAISMARRGNQIDIAFHLETTGGSHLIEGMGLGRLSHYPYEP